MSPLLPFLSLALAAAPSPQRLDSGYFGFGAVTARFSDGTARPAAEVYPQNPALARVESQRALARRMFWTGTGGLLVDLACDSAHFVPGRTAGIAVWGLGWGLWLGFAAIADAGLDDLLLEKVSLNASPRLDAPRLAGVPAGAASPATVALAWRFARF